MTIFHQTLATGQAVAIAAMVFAGMALPANAQPSRQLVNAHPTALDRAFVTDMLQEARAESALAQLARKRASNAATTRAANAIEGEWTSLRARLTALAVADAAPVRGALSTTQQAALWHLGRTPSPRFDRVFLRDAQRGNDVALNRMREEDATANALIQQFLYEARPLISGYQAMLTDDIERLPKDGWAGTAGI